MNTTAFTGGPTARIAPHALSHPQIQPRFLSPEQAAAFLGGLNSRTVTRWAREGYLPAYPIGEGKRRLWRFLASDLESWMLSRGTGQISSMQMEDRFTLSPATGAPTKEYIQ